MSNKSKLFIKFIRIYPYLALANILINSVESIVLDVHYLSDFLCWFVGYSYFALIPILFLSYRMNYCSYHRVPIFALYLFLILEHILNGVMVLDEVYYSFYSLSILIITIFTFALSYYLYKHKKPDKR